MKNILFIAGFMMIIAGLYMKITDREYANWILIIGIIATAISYNHVVNALKKEQKRVNEKLGKQPGKKK